MAPQIGAQMYTIRDFCKTPADIAKSCKRLKEIGFGAVQASALGPIEATELRKILDDTGLVCAATHRGLEQMKDAAKILDEHEALGCELTAIGGFGWNGPGRSEWEQFCKDYNAIAKPLAERGLKIGYHNHSHEFSPFDLEANPSGIAPSEVPMQLLLDRLEAPVWFEIDTYWVQHGGADPAEWIEKCAGRLPAIHLKDMTISTKREHKMCEVGRGNINWARVRDAAKKAGVQWYLIERDAGDLDPFESLKISYEAVRTWGLE